VSQIAEKLGAHDERHRELEPGGYRMAYDYKKEFAALYAPTTTPTVQDVGAMQFLAVDGDGDPNEANGAYAHAVQLLYGLQYTVKMSKKSPDLAARIPGYFDYVVPPLEGLWWSDGDGSAGVNLTDKTAFHWTSMIRVPDFVTPSVLHWAKASLSAKHPEIHTDSARIMSFTEGLVVQALHRGPYALEPTTVAAMEAYATAHGYVLDFSETHKHHEIYLSDPRRTSAEKLRTIIRHPLRALPTQEA
jgi:hypothetical protein